MLPPCPRQATSATPLTRRLGGEARWVLAGLASDLQSLTWLRGDGFHHPSPGTAGPRDTLTQHRPHSPEPRATQMWAHLPPERPLRLELLVSSTEGGWGPSGPRGPSSCMDPPCRLAPPTGSHRGPTGGALGANFRDLGRRQPPQHSASEGEGPGAPGFAPCSLPPPTALPSRLSA